MTCDLCLAAGGRFNANRECCQLRHVAGLPPVHRQAVFDKAWKEIGFEAMEKLKEKVRIEFARLREIRRNGAKTLRVANA